MINYTLINETVFAIIEALFILIIYQNIFKSKMLTIHNSMKSSLFIVFYATFFYWSLNYVPIGFHRLLVFVFSTITLVLLTNINIKQSLLVILLFSTIVMISEGIIMTLFIFVSDSDVSTIINNPAIKFQYYFLSKSFEYLIIVFLEKTILNNFSITLNYTNNPFLIFISLGIILMSLIAYSINYVITIKTNLIVYVILLILLFFFLIGFGYLVYDEQRKLWTIKEKLKLQDEYIKNIESIVNIIRREKHDFANHINTIYALCTLDIDKAVAINRIKTYIGKLSYDLKSSYHFYNTGNEYIDALLAIKSHNCYENNIHLDVDFESSLKNLDFDSNNLVSIVSNILDNAIEALINYDSNEIKKVVSLSTYIENNHFYLSIANNGPIIPNDKINKIFSNGYSTKTSNSDDHGLGLYITKQLINKNKGYISVSSTDYETEFLIDFNLNNTGREFTTAESYSKNMV